MRQDIYNWIKENKDQLSYLRLQPMWYRKLTRNPQEYEAFGTEAVYHYEKSIPHRINKLTNGVQAASMMLNLIQSMNGKG
ncbi:YlbE-like family protein [Bacillus sp. 1P06AnD]|uniref:YlbE-like family protein n=1 Tax=Bacillus sp. 1P06AnD TaxID=3132208 RepID=UPI0039A02E6F